MSKRKDKNKKEEPVVPEKYVPENLLENLCGREFKDHNEVDRLKNEAKNIKVLFNDESKKHIDGTSPINENLLKKERDNAYLNKEIKDIKDEKEDFERNIKENFARKFEEVEKEKKDAIEKITEEMNSVKEDLEQRTNEKEELIEKVEKLEIEIKRLNHVNTLTIQNYENKIKEVNNRHHQKIKDTTEKFENFLKNNQELLNSDLYTVYRNLKLKFDLKLKECIDYKKKNNNLEENNKICRFNMENNDDIINECAKEQQGILKKANKLQEQLDNKDQIIQKMQNDYRKKIEEINNKFGQVLQENANEIQNLKNEIEDRNKKILYAQQASKEIINERKELELFFIDQLKECRKEIVKKRKIENERKNCYLPYLNRSASISSSQRNYEGSKYDDSVYITSIKRVDIKEMDPESKEKLIRSLLIKLNEGGTARGFKNLRNSIK